MISLGKYWVGVECGQRLWRPRSWRRARSADNVFRFRKFYAGGGIAFGPLMIGWNKRG